VTPRPRKFASPVWTPVSSSRAARGIPASCAAEIPRLRLGMTIAALRFGMRKPGRGGTTLVCHPERTRGICALRGAEIPRLRLGMTMGAMRLAMTIAALRLGTTCGAVRKHEAKPGCNDAGLSSRATRGIPALRAAEVRRVELGMTPHRHPERTRGIAALRAAEIPRRGLGMTPDRHPERTRGISPLRAVEIPRLRLGMTMGALRPGMTKTDGRERQAVGRFTTIRSAR
jgi:hypothetical protein